MLCSSIIADFLISGTRAFPSEDAVRPDRWGCKLTCIRAATSMTADRLANTVEVAAKVLVGWLLSGPAACLRDARTGADRSRRLEEESPATADLPAVIFGYLISKMIVTFAVTLCS